jgi:catechol 2,3-dioxygenase-like lactoylglutathione lyase family enzyme
MVQFMGLAHLHLKVADAERSARFYEAGFGMQRLAVKHDGQLIALVMPGCLDVLTLSEGTIGGGGRPEFGPRRRPWGDRPLRVRTLRGQPPR